MSFSFLSSFSPAFVSGNFFGLRLYFFPLNPLKERGIRVNMNDDSPQQCNTSNFYGICTNQSDFRRPKVWK